MTLKSGTILALAFASISMTAVAADPMTPKAGMTPMEHHQSMDTNKDGMLSKEEFMTHHDQMWADMNKDLVLLRCPDRLPYLEGCGRHRDVLHAERREGIQHGRDHGGRCGDRARLTAAFDAERVVR